MVIYWLEGKLNDINCPLYMSIIHLYCTDVLIILGAVVEHQFGICGRKNITKC